MKKRIILAIFLWLSFSPSLAMAKVKVPILVYHSIDEYKGLGSKELYVTPENFEQQIRYLKENGYTLLTFEQWQEIDKVKKPIFLTFDDGYKNNLHAAAVFQKLKDERFKPVGTIFVLSDFIGREGRLTKADLKNLTNLGLFSIQSHTATHPDLTKPINYEYELNESKHMIEQITGKPVIALAYPYGSFNERVVKETKKYYQFGLTTTPGPYIQSGLKNEKYLLPRIYIKYSSTIKDFADAVRVE